MNFLHKVLSIAAIRKKMKPKTLEQDFKTTRLQMLLSPKDKSMLRTIAKLHNTSMNELLTESFKQRYSLEINKIRYS